MSDKTMMFLVFVVSAVALIYVEYIADHSDPVVQECEANGDMANDCVEPAGQKSIEY